MRILSFFVVFSWILGGMSLISACSSQTAEDKAVDAAFRSLDAKLRDPKTSQRLSQEFSNRTQPDERQKLKEEARKLLDRL